jgi:hypothetical protein
MNHQCIVMNHPKKTSRMSRLLHLSNRPWLYKTCKTFNYWQELQSGIQKDTILQELHLSSIKKEGSASQWKWQVCQAGCEIMGEPKHNVSHMLRRGWCWMTGKEGEFSLWIRANHSKKRRALALHRNLRDAVQNCFQAETYCKQQKEQTSGRWTWVFKWWNIQTSNCHSKP